MENKNVFTAEIVKNDLEKFFTAMAVSRKKIDKVLNDEVVELFTVMFNEGELKLNENDELEQTLDDGRIFTIKPRRATLQDLNQIKPMGYDKMDQENQSLVPVSFLTGIPFKTLKESYYKSDLDVVLMIANFL